MVTEEQRKVEAIKHFFDFSLGTLWWVKDSLWESQISGFVRKKKNKSHPGLSLGRKNISSLYQTVPMLLGSHSNRDGFPLNGLSEKEIFATGGCTRVVPCFFPIRHVYGADPDILKNTFKPKLNEFEMLHLKRYLTKKGVSYDE